MKSCHNRKYSVIDLFSGCGGSAEGFRRSGFDVKAAVDSNLLACESFKQNFPDSHVFPRSIIGLSGEEILKEAGISDPDSTVILACPPCQGFSAARRVSQRADDQRNQLIFEFVRLVEEIRPIAFVMENVPGMVGPIGKTIFNRAMERLSKAGYEKIVYDVFQVIDYGVPQKRKRLVVFGTRDVSINLHLPNKTHGKDGNGLLPYSTVRESIGSLPKLRAGERSSTDSLHIAARLSETNLERLQYIKHDGGDRSTLPTHLLNPCHRGKDVHPDTYTRMWWDRPSPTITGGCTMISKGRFAHPDQDRGISLREAARLQTFPDNFIFKGNFGQIALQIGNAVPVRFAECVAGTLAECLNQRIDSTG